MEHDITEQQEGNGESGDAGIFEITDFTNATQWESFIADLEHLFRQWELAKSDHEYEYGGIQHRKTEHINYSKRKFVVSLEVEGGQKKKEKGNEKDGVAEWPTALFEMRNSSSDFPPRTHHLARWYGLSQFVVICPSEGEESLHSQAQANLMLSSVSIAIANTGCTTPVFVQLHQPWRQVYVGMCESGRIRVDYSVTHLRHPPTQFNHLSGLLNIYKSKLQGSVKKMEPVEVAIRFLYVLRHWSLNDWPVEPLGDVDKGFDGDYLQTLRVGAFTDPIKELHLSAIWPKLTEELVTDTATFSDLNPSHASVWTVNLHLTENASCILAEMLLNFYQLCYRNGSVAEMLGRTSLWEEGYSGVMSDSYSKPLDRLTSPGTTLASPLFHSVVYTATQRMESGRLPEENISEKDLEEVIKFLFPDAYTADSTSHAAANGDSDLVFKLKSAPLDSLTCRLAKALAIVNTECGVKAMCKVWHEVSLELRYRWENGIPLPHILEGPPNMKCCLLHQKLQMLNCSIHHKIKHNQQQQQQKRRTKSNHTFTTNESETLSQLGAETKVHSQSNQPATICQSSDSIVNAGGGGGGDVRVSSEEEDEFFEALESHDDLDNQNECFNDNTTTEEGGFMSRGTNCDESDRSEEVMVDEISSTQPRSHKLTEGSYSRIEGGVKTQYDGLATEDTGANTSDGSHGDADRGSLGRLKLCGDLVLVATGDPMYIPVTQDHAPLTEDHVWEQQAVMAKLGTTEEAARLRAKMQSSSLMSDMQAFKAANPGCLLEDFVRWYSPRDWVEEGEEEEDEKDETGEGKISSKFEVEQREEEGGGEGWGGEGEGWEGGEWDVVDEGDNTELTEIQDSNETTQTEKEPGRKKFVTGRLSMRMRQPGGVWREAWSVAEAIPTHRQKRLFDDTKEAEKVLHYLAGLKTAELGLLVLPVLTHCAIKVLKDKHEVQPLSVSECHLHDAISLLSSIPHPTIDSLPKYKEVISLLSQTEHLQAAAYSLRMKLRQGLDLSGTEDGSAAHMEDTVDSEISASIEVILQEPELVLQDPSTSQTGLALKGLLIAQVASRDLEEQETSRRKIRVSPHTFPPPSGREFILRSTLPHPTPHSLPTPQRMYCVLTPIEFRLAGAFTSDILIT